MFCILTFVLLIVTVIIMTFCLLLKVSSVIPLVVFWGISFIVMSVAVPKYFKNTRIEISESGIVSVRGFLSERREYMPMDSVKSVTVILTPLGGITGLNFIIINALGAKILLPFMRRRDCLEATEYIDSIIGKREGSR